ncbi:hypothetical protein P9112_013150 [Eukaryota sp. TZLM1-RC]
MSFHQCPCCEMSRLHCPYDVVLASSSPRRRDILSQLFPNLKIIPSDFDEDSVTIENPIDLVLELSRKKAFTVATKPETCNSILIATDTVVVLDNVVLGKPSSPEMASQMLNSLSGRSHEVISGITLAYHQPDGTLQHQSFTATSKVFFKKLNQEQIDQYVDTGCPFDKAGGYGIQTELGSKLVDSFDGCFLNIVGFPVGTFRKRFLQFVGEVCA